MAKGTRRNKTRKTKTARVPVREANWAWAFESILGKAMARGQLIPLAISIILIITVLRLPPEELVGFVGDILDSFKRGAYLGWALFLIALLAWKGHVKIIRKQSSEEMRRIGKEKNRAQERLLDSN